MATWILTAFHARVQQDCKSDVHTSYSKGERVGAAGAAILIYLKWAKHPNSRTQWKDNQTQAPDLRP